MYLKIFILFFVLTARPCLSESKLKNELVEQGEVHEPGEAGNAAVPGRKVETAVGGREPIEDRWRWKLIIPKRFAVGLVEDR